MADYDKALKDSGLHTDVFKHQPGTYLWLGITPGAADALASLKELDDEGLIRVWILTKTPSKSPYAYTEKVLWYAQKFPWLEDRVILTHDKHLMGTREDFLLDDRPHKGNANLFPGDFVFFDTAKPEETWLKFVQLIRDRIEEYH